MKFARTLIKTSAVFLSLISIFIFTSLIYVNKNVSNDYLISTGQQLKINSVIPLRASRCSGESEKVNYNTSDDAFKMDLKMLGIIPAKQINVRVVDEMSVALLGTPFGIKIYTDGVLVVGFTDIDTDEKDKNPAKSAGLKEGDFIVSLNGTNVYTNEDVANIIRKSEGELIVAKIIQKGKQKTISFYPAKSKTTGIYRAGIWVKDSSAGIGTMTFYSPSYNIVAGLGHGICDSDTGTLLSLSSGEFVTADIISCKKGSVGKAGELTGVFTGQRISTFNLNSENGVYGNVTCDISLENMVTIAHKQEVRNAKAHILTTVNGGKPDYYSCTVKIRNQGSIQNLLVEITDERLLEATGGIVQGMSGSPIIQNGKLVGAVTHVLVDDPKKGYGIFAENMLETAKTVGEDSTFFQNKAS